MTPKTVKFSILTIMIVGLSGCEDLGIDLGGNAPELRPSTATQKTLSGEVERADIFSETGNAIWDGRPTLGGQWVASVSTKDLERVRITRTDTGQSVEGALFRIEPGTPGPDLMLSSDAARALGIVAGSPTPISVVALRDAAPAPVPAAEEPVVLTEDASQAEIETTALEPQRSDDAEAPAAAPAPAPAAATSNDSSLAPQSTSIPAARNAQSSSGGPKDPSVGTAAAPTQEVTKKPVLEIATFKTEQEADIALAKLASQGLVARKTTRRVLFSKQWIVFLGPFENSAELVEARKAASAAGFTEAFVTVL